MNAPLKNVEAQVHCPMCTHTVPAEVESSAKRVRVVQGQKCPRCQASLDASAVVFIRQAA